MASTYFTKWEKVCESVCLCTSTHTHTTFHEVSLTSQTLVRKGPGSGSSPHTGTARGCSHRSVCRCTDVHLFHTRLCLREKNGSESNRNGTEIDRCLRMIIDSVQRLWLWEHREVGVRSLGGNGGGCAYPGIVWCFASGILLGTHRRTSLVRWHTGTGTGSWSSCTHRCLSRYKVRLYFYVLAGMFFTDRVGLLPLQAKPSGPSS